jgi:hypothetical protein
LPKDHNKKVTVLLVISNVSIFYPAFGKHHLAEPSDKPAAYPGASSLLNRLKTADISFLWIFSFSSKVTTFRLNSTVR